MPTREKLTCKKCDTLLVELIRHNDLARTLIVYCAKCKAENLFYTIISQVSNDAIEIFRKEGLIKQ